MDGWMSRAHRVGLELAMNAWLLRKQSGQANPVKQDEKPGRKIHQVQQLGRAVSCQAPILCNRLHFPPSGPQEQSAEEGQGPCSPRRWLLCSICLTTKGLCPPC
jgi:hypothetical protein